MVKKSEKEKIIRLLREILLTLGLDLSDVNYAKTAERFAKYLIESTSTVRDGYSSSEILKYFDVDFPNHKNNSISDYQNIILLNTFEVHSICSHHLLPVLYKIKFAYIPENNHMIGFSKVIRIIRYIAKQPINQENFTQNIVDIFMQNFKLKAVGVIVYGKHLCMKIRGVNSNVINETEAFGGNKDYIYKLKERLFFKSKS